MNSDQVRKGMERAPHRSLMRATGLKGDDFSKPFIGVCNSFNEVIPGHVHVFGLFTDEDTAQAAAGRLSEHTGWRAYMVRPLDQNI